MLDDKYNINGDIYTGREICHVSDLNQKEGCLAAALLRLGFAGIKC